MDEYFTVQQVAEKLQVAVRTIWDWIRKGKINAICLSNHNYRISQTELVNFINSKSTTKQKIKK